MKTLATILCLLTLFSLASSQSIDEVYKNCIYIKHDIKFTLSNVEKVELEQNGNVHEFTETENTDDPEKSDFKLEVEGKNLEPGIARLIVHETSNETVIREITFTNLFFNPDLERMHTYKTITITENQCQIISKELKFIHINSENQREEILFNSPNNCDVYIHDSAPAGYYEVMAHNPMTSEDVYVTYFILISEKSNITKSDVAVEMPVPMKLKDGYMTFKLSYSTQWEPIKELYVIRETSEVPFVITADNSKEYYFEYTLNGHVREYTVHFKLEEFNIMYYLERILLENYFLLSFDKFEKPFGYYFSIDKQFALSQTKDRVELVFDSIYQAETYKTKIFFKDYITPGQQLQKASCEVAVENVLYCQLNIQKPSVYAIGITEGMVSAQLVSLFTYTLDSDTGVNICVIETIDSDNAKFNVNVFLPEFDFGNDLVIKGSMVSDTTYPSDCDISKGLDTSNQVILTCDANKLDDGLFGFELGIGYGNDDLLQYFPIEKVNINVRGKVIPLEIVEEELFLTSKEQKLTVKFNSTVPQGYMTDIQLKQHDKVSGTFSVVDDESTGKTKVYHISGLIESGFIFDDADIYYKYPCSDSNDFQDSTFNIRISPNKIKDIKPNFVVIESNSTATVEFNFPIGNIAAELVFESGGHLERFSLSNECCETVQVHGKMFQNPGSYYVSLVYNATQDEFEWGEFFVFESAIVLKEKIDYVRPNELHPETQIELLYGVTLDQVYKVEYINANGERKEVYSKQANDNRNIIVNLRQQMIVIRNFPIQLEPRQSVQFVIYDVIAPEVEIVYTIQCGININLRVANLQLTCNNPAHEGTNYVFFNFTKDAVYGNLYDVENLRTITFDRINRATGESGDFVFCHLTLYTNQDNEGIHCDRAFEIIETVEEEKASVRANVIFDNEDKYMYKYTLKSMTDAFITRYFNEDECYLIDFSIKRNVFGFLDGDEVSEITTTFEAYSIENAEFLSTNISCGVSNKCTPFDELCEDKCFSNSCGNSCDTKCTIDSSNPTQVTCTFTFNPVNIESTIYYRMSERDIHYKPLHIIRVIAPLDECRLVNDKTPSEVKVCTHLQINGLRLFFNDQAEEGFNCEGEVINSLAESCTSLTLSYSELLSDRFIIRVEKDYNTYNSFVLESTTSQISLIQEVMKVYHGALFAQLKDQEVTYIFPDGSDASLIKKIILTHTKYDVKIEIDNNNNCTVDSGFMLKCKYDLSDKIQIFDIGNYSISYIHEHCENEFSTELVIEVQFPPIVAISLVPSFSWLCTSETFTISYLYYFYNLDNYRPQTIELVKVDNTSVRVTVSAKLDEEEPNKINFYSTDNCEFVEPGRYFIIEHYIDSSKDREHKDLTILFIRHHIKIHPESYTYYTDEPAPLSFTTNFVYTPIFREQVRSVRIPTFNKDVEHILTQSDITFIFTKGLIDFTQEGTHEIIITEINGSEVSFTVYVLERKKLSEITIDVIGPKPGYENTTNIVEFKAAKYDLSRITKIQFELKNEFGETVPYTVDRTRVIESYDQYSCSLKVQLYLRHNSFYNLISIHNENTDDMKDGLNYKLQGFFLESHFYLVSKETNYILYHVNFYNKENAREITSIYQDNVPANCLPEVVPYIYVCTHNVSLINGGYADLLNVTITANEFDIARTLQVHLIEYEIDDYCVLNKEPSVDVEVTFTSDKEGELDTIRGVFGNKYFSGNVIRTESIVKYTLPIDYTIKKYELFVEFQKFGQYFRYLIPKSNIKIIPQVTIVEVPKNTITEDEDKEGGYFDIILNEGISENDISRAVFKNKNPNLPSIELSNWKIMEHYEGNTVFNFPLTNEIIQAKGVYYINIYDACGNLVEPADGYEVFISYESNYLTHISPRAMILSDLGRKKFTFIYEKSMSRKPEVKLMDKDGKESDYAVIFEDPFNGDGVRLPVTALIRGSTSIGLFRIKTTFIENTVTDNVDYSNLSILLYENEVELSQTEFTFYYNTELNSITIPLKKSIIQEQISRITLKVIGVQEEVEITKWELTNNKEITVTFNSKLKITNEFQVILYLAKDTFSKEAVSIKPNMDVRFDVNREFVYLGNDVNEFKIIVTPLYDNGGLYSNVEGIVSSREELVFNLETGKYQIEGESKSVTRRFVATYKKLTTVNFPEEIQLRYRMAGMVNDRVMEQTVSITDNSRPFFDFGMQRKVIYKNQAFEMNLLDKQYFRNMNYAGLKAYFLYNTDKKLYLKHDTQNPRRFYLEVDDLEDVRGLKVEIVITEKNNDSAFVNRGQKIEFSSMIEPPLLPGICQNDGILVGGNCQCKIGYYGQYCGIDKSSINDFTKEFEDNAKEVFKFGMSLENVDTDLKEGLKDYSAMIKSGVTENNLNLQETVGESFSEMDADQDIDVETLFLIGDLMIDEYNQNEATRRLESKSKLTPTDILKKLRDIVEKLEVTEYKVYKLPIQNIHFDKVIATKENFKHYQEFLKFTRDSYFETENIKESENNYYLITFGELNKKTSLNLKMEYLSNDGRLLEEVNIEPSKHEGEITYYFCLDQLAGDSNLNSTLLQDYSKKGINVYNNQDPAFVDKCYSTNPDHFDYDLTQKYRKNLYQGHSLEIDNESCEYIGLNSDGTYISYTCNYPTQSGEFKVALDFNEQPLSENAKKTENFLALKCLDSITDVSKNIALWLFAVLAVLFVVGVVLKFKFSQNSDDSTSIQKTTAINLKEDSKSKDSKVESKQTTSPKDIQVQIEQSTRREKSPETSLGTIISKNFKKLHPITANYFNENKSITSIFILTISTIFGFNALYYKESYIEDRIFDKSRNSFGYPLVNEASIIFASIFTTVLFTVLTKLLTIKKEKEDKNSVVRHIICTAICGILMVFWWVYSIGFCGMYKITQKGWLYAGIWALLFNWIIFAPVSILIISALEKKCKEKMEIVSQLFWV